MSSYAGIYVNGKEVFTYRNEVFPEVRYLFADNEMLRLKGHEALPYASNWYVGVDDGDVEELEVYALHTTASALRERLNVLGFGEPLVRKVVERLIAEKIERTADMLEHFQDHEEIKHELTQELDALRQLDYDSWKTEVGEHIKSKKASAPDWRDRGPLEIFEYADERVLLRVIVEQVEDDEPVLLDMTQLYEGGWIDADADEDDEAYTSWDLGTSPPIIITEGSYDALVLRGAIEVLRPHLAAYIRFLDYDVGNEGGAAAAVKMLKSFAAAGVSNRIVAIFDNDSAAYEAVMSLRASKLPAHYAVAHYPDLESVKAYPTLGPQGNTVMNVNRLAGSIELYLGSDVLTSPDGSLTPVQWKGYMNKVGTYQGEVMNKAALQSAFRKKLKDAKSDPAKVQTQDWAGLELILERLIETLSSLPGARSAGQQPG